MKTLRLPFFLLLCLGVLAWTGCGNDDEDLPVINQVETLNYDGPNVTAPLTSASVLAAYFPPNQVAPFRGRTLEAVEFVLAELPPETRVVVYEEGDTQTEPGAVLYESPVLNGRIQNAVGLGNFLTHRLSTPIELGDRGVWLGISTGIQPNSSITLQTVGCDAEGNGVEDGDWMLLDGQWISFFAFTGETVAINWNIRGVLSPAQ